MTRWALAVAGLWLFALAPAQAAGLAQCAWSKLPDAIRHDYVAAYTRTPSPDVEALRQDMNAAAAVLQKNDALVVSTVQACVGRSDIPVYWMRGLAVSRAIQTGSADALTAMSGIGTAALDAAWTSAPEAARQCTLANAAKVFGLFNEPCPDARAPLWFLQDLKIDPATNRAAAEQALVYFNAKAQQEWGEAMVSKFIELHPAPSAKPPS